MESFTDQILQLTREASLLARGGRILFANDSARELLGPDLQGKNIRQLFGSDVAGTQSHHFLAQLSGDRGGYVLRVTDTDEGRVFFVDPPEDRPAILSEAFLYSLHTALMNIGIAASALRERAEAQDDREALADLCLLTASYYRILRTSANASLALTDSRGGVPFSPAMTDLSALCESIVSGTLHYFPGLRLRLDAGEYITAPADPGLIRQMLLNLLSNCMIHGGMHCTITLRLTDAPTGPVFSVSDDGPGIPARELHTVFDRYRHDLSLERVGSGPGLGLTVCRAIAALHGGTLLMESREGQGTQVRVSLNRDSLKMRMFSAKGDPNCSSVELITGLADCLPVESFSPQYLD